MELTVCPTCNKEITPTDYFCPQCGKKLKNKPPSATVARQIFVYTISFFLPPFGLIPAIAYFRQKDSESKKIGFIAVTLTVISILLSLWLVTKFIKQFNQELNSQIKLYNEIGY